MKLSRSFRSALVFMVAGVALAVASDPVSPVAVQEPEQEQVTGAPAAGPFQEFEPVPQWLLNDIDGFEAPDFEAAIGGIEGEQQGCGHQNVHAVFVGRLIDAQTYTPASLAVLVTDYTFAVEEYLVGSGEVLVTLSNLGGELAEGEGMTTAESYKLTPEGRFIVYVGEAGTYAPFATVLQIDDRTGQVADASGRAIVGFAGGYPIAGDKVIAPTLFYLPGAPSEDMVENLPPDVSSEPLPEQEGDGLVPTARALAANDVFDAIRGGAEVEPQPFMDVAGLTQKFESPDYIYCGYARTSLNYFCYLPDNSNWSWFNGSGGDWNTLVTTNSKGPDWLIGYYNRNGQPIRTEAPKANNGKNNLGLVSDAQLTAGGYPTWGAMGANGVCFRWYKSGSCTEIKETDVFVNPVLKTDQAQFRKTMTHELGHALSLNHENRYFALLYPGTYQQPPNYSSTSYARMDDLRGVRAMLAWVNAHWANTWLLRSWTDMATWSQSHSKPGSAGSLVMTDLSKTIVKKGDTVDLRHLQIENRGNVSAGKTYLRVYLSTNTVISSADIKVYEGYWSSFGGQAHWSNGTLRVRIPASTPSGSYYVGWIVTPSVSELSSANNTTVLRKGYSTFAYTKLTVQ